MKFLAFDTSTETLSIAVQHGDRVYSVRGPGGARASASLIPDSMALLAQAGLTLAELDVIAFGQGPGAFTGLRGACAVAQGLAFGAGKPVLPVGSLMAVAEAARQQTGATRVLAVLDARMNEVYSAACEYVQAESPDTAKNLPYWREVQPLQVGAAAALHWPADAASHANVNAPMNAPVSGHVSPAWTVAGNAFEPYGAQMPAALQLADRAAGGQAQAHVQAIPDAEHMLRLLPALLAQGLAVSPELAMPVYVRDKVADTTAERAALAAAKLARQAAGGA
jgi:tRNA threonylcarbamoyladenosine biosynthesis protein TsaB